MITGVIFNSPSNFGNVFVTSPKEVIFSVLFWRIIGKRLAQFAQSVVEGWILGQMKHLLHFGVDQTHYFLLSLAMQGREFCRSYGAIRVSYFSLHSYCCVTKDSHINSIVHSVLALCQTHVEWVSGQTESLHPRFFQKAAALFPRHTVTHGMEENGEGGVATLVMG